MAEKLYYGMYQGVVTKIADPDKRGRIKAKIASVTGKIESAWADPIIPVAYDGGGDICIPKIGETAWFAFIEGDSNRPVWFGNWYKPKKTPLGSAYDTKTRIINYADCTITMKKGVIIINVGPGVCDLQIENNKVTVKGNLLVEGNVTAGSFNAVQGKYGGGTVKADSTVHGSNI